MDLSEGITKAKVFSQETIYECLNIIEPDEVYNRCRILRGPLWQVGRPVTYRGKLCYRTYELKKRHVYHLQENHQGNYKLKNTYLKVTSRGNVHEITRDEACEILRRNNPKVKETELVPELRTEEIIQPLCDF